MKKAAVPSILVAVVLLALGVTAEAQQPAGNVARIGYLATASGATELPYIEAFRLGLRELGYVEGKNINIEYRYAEGKFERLPELAEELVRLKVEILVVPSATAARAAKKSNVTIPIVMTRAGDPFSSGLVASLARPGGNVTGLYQYSPELLGKRLELLKEVVPKVSRFAFLSNSVSMFKNVQADAKGLGIRFQLVEVKGSNPDFDGAFRVIVNERIGAVVTEATPSSVLTEKRFWS
jgi:putative ABC transport system substrate-binding protein